MIRVAVLDDHPAVLGGLQRLVERDSGLRPIAFAETYEELRRDLDRDGADVVVVDYDLARGNGLMVCQRLKARRPAPSVLIYSAYAGPGLAVAARVAGADGLVHKSEPVADLLVAVRRLAEGGRVLPDVQPEQWQAAMSRLEQEDVAVAAMLLADESHRAIAETLAVDDDEVAWRARRIVARMRPGADEAGGGADGT